MQDNRVYLQMGGGCQGCGAADITLKSGIERLIKEELPEVAEVLDTTDHASGHQPLLPGRQGLARPRRPAGPVMDRLLLLLPTTTYRTEDFIDAARTLGVDLVCRLRAAEHLRGARARSPPDARLRRPRRRGRARWPSWPRRRPLDAVVGVDDLTTVAAARHRRAAGPARQRGRRRCTAARDKYQMRQCLAARRRADPALPLASRSRTIPSWPRRGRDVSLRAQAARALGQPRRHPRRRRRPSSSPAFRAHRARSWRATTWPCAATPRSSCWSRSSSRARGRAGGPAGGRRAAHAGALRQARSARRPVLRGDDLRHALAAAGGRAGRRSQRVARAACAALGLREGPVHAELRAERARARGCSRSRRARSAGCARAPCASARACRWRRSSSATRSAGRSPSLRARAAAAGVDDDSDPARRRAAGGPRPGRGARRARDRGRHDHRARRPGAGAAARGLAVPRLHLRPRRHARGGRGRSARRPRPSRRSTSPSTRPSRALEGPILRLVARVSSTATRRNSDNEAPRPGPSWRNHMKKFVFALLVGTIALVRFSPRPRPVAGAAAASQEPAARRGRLAALQQRCDPQDPGFVERLQRLHGDRHGRAFGQPVGHGHVDLQDAA